MKTLILHVGLHKTGSTAIQDALSDARVDLLEWGYRFPLFKRPDGVAEANHSRMFQLVFGHRPRARRKLVLPGWDHDAAIASYRQQLSDAMASTESLILSGEGIANLSVDELGQVKTLFSGWKIRVVAFIRPAYSYYCSATQERIKSGSTAIGPGKVRMESDTVSKLKAVFDEPEFISFVEACKHPLGPAGSFFDHAGFSGALQAVPAKRNTGLGNIVIRLTAHINRYLTEKHGAVSQDVFNSQSLAMREARFLLTDAELSRYQSEFSKENDALYRSTGLDFKQENMRTAPVGTLTLGQSFRLMSNLAKQRNDIRQLSVEYLTNMALIPLKFKSLLISYLAVIAPFARTLTILRKQTSALLKRLLIT
ncbi:hypothetical protein [Alteromonas sp. CYL-A6]|uniref:hypothetical protein n=1 Tax=Alteromonas nitratireducens TaxID=3390813 RepID=UPI0034A6BC15